MNRYLDNKMNEILHLALRKNKGKKLLPIVCHDLSQQLELNEQKIRFVDLEISDILREKFNQSWSKARSLQGDNYYVHFWHPSDKDDLSRFLEKLASKLLTDSVLIFRSTSVFCGAVELNAQEVLPYALRLVGEDQEDFLMSSMSGDEGVVIMLNNDRDIGPTSPHYELDIWGKSFINDIKSITSGE